MKGLSFDPRAVLVGALFAVLAGCGGSQLPAGTSGFVNAQTAPPRKNHSQSFGYTGTRQTFTVPPGVTSVTVTAAGASGEDTSPDSTGGAGGLVKAKIVVTPGEKLRVYVGQAGGYAGPGVGGYNGGGQGGAPDSRFGDGVRPLYVGTGGGGGGASDVRQGGSQIADRVVVAAGGAGAGLFAGCCSGTQSGKGGAGGGKAGKHGANGCCYGQSDGQGGGGGTQTAGGSGGGGAGRGSCHNDGASGSLGVGGDGGQGCGSAYGGGGGGGGGGYFGGGGGGGGNRYSASTDGSGGGGGGGSSYVTPTGKLISDRHGAAPPGNGTVVIAW